MHKKRSVVINARCLKHLNLITVHVRILAALNPDVNAYFPKGDIFLIVISLTDA